MKILVAQGLQGILDFLINFMKKGENHLAIILTFYKGNSYQPPSSVPTLMSFFEINETFWK